MQGMLGMERIVQVIIRKILVIFSVLILILKGSGTNWVIMLEEKIYNDDTVSAKVF